MNPYGAVPEALKETRLTLRDIMGDFLQTKVLQARTEIERAKVETDSAAIAAGLEREKLSNLKDVARMQLDQRRHEETLAQQGEQFQQTLAQQKETAAQRHEIDLAQLANQKRMTDIAAAEAARKYEVRTIGDWAAREGVSPYLVQTMGLDPNRKITRADAENLYNRLEATFKANPSIGMIAHGHTLKAELEDLQGKLKTPGINPDARAGLVKQYEGKLQNFRNLHELILTFDRPDAVKVAEAARKTYAENPALQETYPSFNQFLAVFQRELPETRSAFHNDLAAMQTFFSQVKDTPEEREKAQKQIPDLLLQVNKRAPDVSATALQSVKEIEKRSGPVAAKTYLEKMLNYYERFPKVPAREKEQTTPAIQAGMY